MIGFMLNLLMVILNAILFVMYENPISLFAVFVCTFCAVFCLCLDLDI